jgi:hypothetical protein
VIIKLNKTNLDPTDVNAYPQTIRPTDETEDGENRKNSRRKKLGCGLMFPYFPFQTQLKGMGFQVMHSN